jgi:hypothetical protein
MTCIMADRGVHGDQAVGDGKVLDRRGPESLVSGSRGCHDHDGREADNQDPEESLHVGFHSRSRRWERATGCRMTPAKATGSM